MHSPNYISTYTQLMFCFVLFLLHIFLHYFFFQHKQNKPANGYLGSLGCKMNLVCLLEFESQAACLILNRARQSVGFSKLASEEPGRLGSIPSCRT